MKDAVRKLLIYGEAWCHYCCLKATLVTGETIYPHRKDLHSLNFWECGDCGSYVGCHKPSSKWGTTGVEPLGTPANPQLRKERSETHKEFDPMWRELKIFDSRKSAYYWLSKNLGISFEECHIGYFDLHQCVEAQGLCIEKKIKHLGFYPLDL